MDLVKLLHEVVLANSARRYSRAIQLSTIGLNRTFEGDVRRALWLERAVAEVAISAWSAAQVDCEAVLREMPCPRAHGLLARCHFERKRHSEAQRAIEIALVDEPQLIEHWILYAEILSAVRQHDAAIRAAQRARSFHQGRATLNLFLKVLAAAGEPLEVIATVERELTLADRDADTWATLGFAYNSLGNSDAAEAAFHEVLRIDPTRSDARCGLGYAMLRRGDYTRGFALHEHRQSEGGNVGRLGVPPWLGENLAGKHLFVWVEQGMGDVIQFVRYLPLVHEQGARTTLLVPKVLVRLLRSNPELGDIESDQPGFCAAEFQTLLLSLPHRLRVGNDVTLAPHPYLQAEPELVRRWRGRLPAGPKIALSWQGNPRYAGEPWRSIPLALLEPIVRRFRDRYRFVSLQKNYGREQLEGCSFASEVLDLGDEIDCNGDAYVDSLAILSQVELLLSTDTSLVHLAGSANVCTWLILPRICDWRWGTDPRRTVWYPNTRLFRQPTAGDWPSVVEEVARALAEFRV